ncbi:DUF3427 domain-containing protein [Luteibacter yeojuensis]|uniref:DUF3427 domain-containing protein n=1 Tax=Luteibacter yeojuensis TaxID=345309 RepID=A0A7X5QXI4_9GAMM|nr:DUF3427 domain-containing protein [Luteibacter yeojuensis]NID17248.1 DUF3427 domain-containing protein [Luteibacter yeojuensis]
MKDEFIDLSRFRLGDSYSRAEIAELGSITPKNFVRPTGITEFANAVLLFVTLEKDHYTYRDQFEGNLFWWQSQTRQTQESPVLQSLISGEREAHLFVRVRAKASSTLPFVYCGRLSPPLMKDERPVTCEFEVLDFVQHPTGELARVYAWRSEAPMATAEAERRQALVTEELAMPRAHGQGRMRDYQRRRTVEIHAMEIAKEHYATLGYRVIDTSSTHPFDLRCLQAGVEKRVEVKGTQSIGHTVDVTAGEIQSAWNGRKDGYTTDLFLVHSISLRSTGQDVYATGGEVVKVEDWQPLQAALKPIAFRYQL